MVGFPRIRVRLCKASRRDESCRRNPDKPVCLKFNELKSDKKKAKWFNYANMPKRHLVKCGRCLTYDGRRVGHSGMVLEVLRANKKAISSSSRFFYNKHLDGCLISTLLSFIYWQFQVQRLL